MKTIKIILISMAILSTSYASAQKKFYDFVVTTIDGGEFHFSDLKGKKVIVVNTASKCGYTPQYEDLEKLYKEYKDKGLVILGFPANNFMKQEPGTDAEIKTFCTINYGVSFPMMSKISVKGDDIDPLYLWLTTKDLNGVLDSKVKWNFQKYLIDENGVLVDVAYSGEKPYDEKIINWLNKE